MSILSDGKLSVRAVVEIRFVRLVTSLCLRMSATAGPLKADSFNEILTAKNVIICERKDRRFLEEERERKGRWKFDRIRMG